MIILEAVVLQFVRVCQDFNDEQDRPHVGYFLNNMDKILITTVRTILSLSLRWIHCLIRNNTWNMYCVSVKVCVNVVLLLFGGHCFLFLAQLLGIPSSGMRTAKLKSDYYV